VQREFFGFNAIFKLKDLCDEYKPKHIFLVTGQKSFFLSGAEKKIRSILEKIAFTRFDSFSVNLNISEVRQGIVLFKKVNPDLVIAIGGGSAIDMAKIVNVLSAHGGEPEEYIIGSKKLEKSGKTLIAIPITAGTGSDATYFATIYIDKTKYSLGDRYLTMPTVSIVDPSLTESMPKYLTASTGLDALCQGVESMWSINSTDESRKYAKESVSIAFKNIEKAVNNPSKDARLNMAKAAHLSGKAINISKTTACHSISYPITSYFGVSHGHSVALTIPSFIEFNGRVSEKDCNDSRGAHFVKKQMHEIIRLMDCKDDQDAKNRFQKMMMELGVKTKFSELKINKKGVALIIEKGFTPERMNNNPRKVTREDLKVILEELL